MQPPILHLPEGPGIYAWWETRDSAPGDVFFGDPSRPVYLAAADNLASSIEADATRIRDSDLRKNLAAAMADHLGLRSPPTRGRRPPLNKDENSRISQWMNTMLLVSWCEMPTPEPYRHALNRALDPHLAS